MFYCIFDEIYAALVSIRDVFKKKNLPNKWHLEFDNTLCLMEWNQYKYETCFIPELNFL